MALRLYNSLTKFEQEFKPMVAGHVSMYTCGPTVYSRPHIGNYSSFLMADLLRRWLEVGHKLKVTHVKNITDVGHLAADADDGEDKVEKQAREIAKQKRGADAQVTHDDVIAVARMYEDQYLEDEKALNLVPAEHRPRASEYVEQMKVMIDDLLDKGFAYPTEDSIYFRVSKFPEYGKLSGNIKNVASGVRVKVNEEKEDPRDFALWKYCVGPNEHHVLRWSSPGPKKIDGFPGWHIECSAMSRSLLGDQIDIHTGGEDNIFPHHECEIAQSESVTGKKPFVRLWLHKRRIDLAGEKMSKSLGNVLGLADIVKMGFDPMDLRFYLLSTHYRTNLKFSEKGLEEAHGIRRSIIEWIEHDGGGTYALVKSGRKIPSATPSDIQEFEQEFDDAMNADLNVSAALAAVFKCMTKMNSTPMPNGATKEALKIFITKIRETFGCFESVQEELPDDVKQLRDQRKAARERKDFKESDRLRDEMKKLGYEVRDVVIKLDPLKLNVEAVDPKMSSKQVIKKL